MSRPPIKFISTISDAGSAKTKRSQHACQDCRKRKRRCPHDFQAPRPSSSNVNVPRGNQTAFTENPQGRLRSRKRIGTPSGLTPAPNDAGESGSACQGPNLRSSNARIAPVAQSSLASQPDNTGPGISKPRESGEPKFVGHLNPEGFFLATARPGASEPSEHGKTLGFWLTQESCDNVDGAGEGSVDAESDSFSQPRIGSTEILPNPSSFQALRAIYFKDIQPLFPILNRDIVPQGLSELPDIGLCPGEATIIQAVCVAASTNPAARPHLYLQHLKERLAPRGFATSLSRSILATFDRFQIRDRLLLIRVLTILSLFSAFSIDDHTAAEYCARAVSNVHTMQLQLDTSRVRRDHTVVSQTFLCVWALDRLNAAFHSRPTLMHARDIGRDMTAAIAGQQGCFRALLLMCSLLDKIIHLYRPQSHQFHQSDQPDQASGTLDIPSFDELIVQADAAQCPTHLLATIEPLYHTVAILSHRFHSLDDPDRSSISYLRSSLSTSRLLHLIQTNLLQPLSNFPFVPYSLALALRVSYRELRLSKTPLYRSQARGQVLLLCTGLEEFGNNYPFTRNLARLARKIICEMDRVATSVLQARHKDTEQPAASTLSTQDGENRTQYLADSVPVVSEHCNHTGDQGVHDDQPQGLRKPEYEFGQYNPESFDDIYKLPDLPDMFEHFDPDFNLEAVEFGLLQNLGLDHIDGIDLTAQNFQ